MRSPLDPAEDATAQEWASSTRTMPRDAGRAYDEIGPGAAMDDAEALRTAADMAVFLGGPGIARVMREVARRLEVYGYA